MKCVAHRVAGEAARSTVSFIYYLISILPKLSLRLSSLFHTLSFLVFYLHEVKLIEFIPPARELFDLLPWDFIFQILFAFKIRLPSI